MFKMLIGLAFLFHSGVLMDGCQAAGKYIGPVAQPVIGQVLSTFANALTRGILGPSAGT